MRQPSRPTRRSLSQVHLVREDTTRELAERFAPRDDQCVLEVGPGTGNVTDHLVRRVRRLVAVEIDPGLAEALAARYRGLEHVRIIQGDILALDAAEVLARDMPGPADEEAGAARVFSALPYHITSAFLEWLLDHRACFSDAVLVLQREVAQKLLHDTPKTRGYLSHRVRFCADVSSIMRVPPSAFSPRPSVSSEALRLSFRKAPPFSEEYEAPLFALVGASFRERRKTLWNNLRRTARYSPEALERARETLGWEKNVRAETLSLEDFSKLLAALTRSQSP
jgi:16S rRNA (adenine1518-N6/adenine1519-N6)-dimethyltransferase